MENKELTVIDIQSVAKSVVASGLFRAMRSEQSAFVLMLLSQAEGLHPIQAVRRYDIVDGKPAKKSDAMLADFMAAGGKVKWIACTDEECTAEFSAPGLSAPFSISWTIGMAKKAGLATKQNWTQYPRAMLRARVTSEGIRMAMPGVVAGIYTPEEVADFDDKPPAQPVRPVIDVTAESVPMDVAKAAESPAAEKAPVAEGEKDRLPSTAKQRIALIDRLKRAGIAEKKQALEWIRKHCGRDVASTAGLWADEAERLIADAGDMAAAVTRAELDASRASNPMPDWANESPPFEPREGREPGEDG